MYNIRHNLLELKEPEDCTWRSFMDTNDENPKQNSNT